MLVLHSYKHSMGRVRMSAQGALLYLLWNWFRAAIAAEVLRLKSLPR